MNIELLRKVQEQIVNHPETFRIDRWNCGTAQCIAGHALSMTGHQWMAPTNEPDNLVIAGDEATEVVAQRELALSFWQAKRLFYDWRWPSEFQVPYRNADYVGRAKIASERIDHFIATDGRE
jgi:hypothetical protein